MLSGVLADGTRTARFSVDGVECAVFAGIEDRGGSTDWVAGASSTTAICCRSLLACSSLALGSCRLDAIVSVPFAGVTLSPHAVVRIGSAGEEHAQPDPEPAGLIQPTKFVRQLSYRALHFEDGETIAGTESDARNLPAACVAVARGGATAGFAMALEVVALPAEGLVYFSFGLGLARPAPGSMFGGSAMNTCGIVQNPCAEDIRHAQSQRFGQRADRDDTVLTPVLKAGSRLAVNLSKRERIPFNDEAGIRTARFFVDGEECAVFVGIEDDGGDSDWVAGVTLSAQAKVRIVAADDSEQPESEPELSQSQKDEALTAAAKGGAAPEVERLIDEGASPDAKDERGTPALVLAAQEGHLDALKLLRRHGANLDATDSYGSTALMHAANWGKADWAEALLEWGADKDVADSSGRTALHWAAREGRLEIARLLVRARADRTKKNKHGQTALELARKVESWDSEDVKQGKAEVAALLEQADANVSAPRPSRHIDPPACGQVFRWMFLARFSAAFLVLAPTFQGAR